MITMFYANMVYGQYHSWKDFRKEVNPADTNEVYNGAFLHVSEHIGDKTFGLSPGWFRADGCPYPESQIDPRLKAWLLLLG